jgi:1,4-dihydroxy-2-naphthoyl-CoA hydrolase
MNGHSEKLMNHNMLHEGLEHDLGIEIVSAEKDLVTARVEAQTRHLNGDGVVHGGMIMAFADVAASQGAVLNLPAGARTTTIESKTNFIRAAQPGFLTCDATPLHLGRSTMLWQSIVRDADRNTLAIVTQTQMVLSQPFAVAVSSTEPHEPVREVPDEAKKTWGVVEGSNPRSTADRRKAQIIKAALKVISKKGFANSAIREIAQEAGMPVPTMYQYLKSKDDILAMMFDSYLGAVEESLRHSTAGAQKAADKLRMAIAANITEFDRFQAHIRVMNRETASLRPELRKRIKNHMLSYIDIFAKIIEEGIRLGEFRPIDARLFANFVAMLCEVWPLRNWSVGAYGPEGVQAGIVDLVLHSLALPEKAT